MSSKRFTRALVLALAVLAPPALADDKVPDSCPVTKPSDTTFKPPAPYNEKQDGRFWYGSKDLWTVLANDGIWRGITSPLGTRNKFWWWREGWKWDTDVRANDVGLVINARRIDGVAPPVGPLRMNNAKLSTGWAMLTMLEITPGCWEITGNYRADYLTMVVWVPDKPLDEPQ